MSTSNLTNAMIINEFDEATFQMLLEWMESHPEGAMIVEETPMRDLNVSVDIW
jgi:hypothetical protein